MKLIGNYISPFVRKISVILLEKKITFEFVCESPWQEKSRIWQYNPLGKAPALQVNPDKIWFDSSIIASYLEQLNIAPVLLPDDPERQLYVRQMEALADGICDAAVWLTRHALLPAGQQQKNEQRHQHKKIERALHMLNKEAAVRDVLNGATLTLADIAAGCTLGYLTFRQLMPDWPERYPALLKLTEKMFMRDSFIRTAPYEVGNN